MIDDYKLMKSLKKKTEKSFKILYDNYYRLVYYQAYLVLKNNEDSEDVAQQVFIRFFNKIDELPLDLNIKAYLVKLSNNAAIDLYRKNKKEISIENVDEIASDDDTKNMLLNFNGLLEEDENKILILRLNFDYSFNEISLEMNETIGTIQSKYYKALKKIKKYYQEEN